MDDTVELILPFDSDDPEFRRGVETGIMWAYADHMEAGDKFRMIIHADNSEMAIRIAEVCEIKFGAEPADDTGEWLIIALEKI
jgi:hypothetical protein